VPTQRTPELVVPNEASLNYSSLSSPHQPGYGVYTADSFGIDQSYIHDAASEFGADNTLLQPAEDSRIGFEHRAFYANLSRQSAILHDYPGMQSLLDKLTAFVQMRMARHSEFAPHGGRHAGLAAWEPSAIEVHHRQIASEAEGGRAAVNSFVPGQFERTPDKNRVLSARITLDGDQQVDILRSGANIPRAAHIGAAQILLNREVGLIAGDETVQGPSFRLRVSSNQPIPATQLTLTVFNQQG
jgi:hypothetical protein